MIIAHVSFFLFIRFQAVSHIASLFATSYFQIRSSCVPHSTASLVINGQKSESYAFSYTLLGVDACCRDPLSYVVSHMSLLVATSYFQIRGSCGPHAMASVAINEKVKAFCIMFLMLKSVR